MNKTTCLLLLILTGCSSGPRESRDDGKSKPSFETSNYLKISYVVSGRMFEDSGNNAFFRVIEIPSEEHLLVYVEKIGVGDEGGNYHLLDRYMIEEIVLGLSNPRLFGVDSLTFIDSVTVSGFFNRVNLKVDLNKKIVK